MMVWLRPEVPFGLRFAIDFSIFIFDSRYMEAWPAHSQHSQHIVDCCRPPEINSQEKSSMGTKNYLIEGGSGTGKTTVAEELERRGYHVVHGDRTLAYYGDPDTGHPMQSPQLDADADKVTWGYQHWIWPVAQVKTLLADQTAPISFFCGHSENSAHFSMLFHGVFVLEVDAEVLRNRLDKRPEDEFGGRPIERELVMRLHKTRQNLLAGAVSIDASKPVDRVADDILSRCSPTQADEQSS